MAKTDKNGSLVIGPEEKFKVETVPVGRWEGGQSKDDPIYRIEFCRPENLQNFIMKIKDEVLKASYYWPPKPENIKVLQDGRIMVLFEKNIY